MQEPKYSHEAYRIDERSRKTNLWRSTPGIPSEFIHQLSALIERDSKLPKLVLYCRVSTIDQEKNGNLDDQTRDALRKLLKMGVKLGRDIIIFEGVETSRIGIEDEDRLLLEQALDEARKRGAVLVAVHRDRFLRNRHLDKKWQHELPTIRDYMDLLCLARDVPLVTIQHPDDPAARSDQIKRGQESKGNRGGRPTKQASENHRGRPTKQKWKERRLAWLPLARELRDAGLSYKRIADRLKANARDDGFHKVTSMTVYNWLKKRI